MKDFFDYARSKFKVDAKMILVYVLVYFTWGMIMNRIGIEAEIAKFTQWWQVFTVYLAYMVPVSLLLRGLPFHMQYAYGLIAMGLLEFAGYALESSYAYPNNLLDQWFGIRNFSLAMALFFAFYFPIGNWAVGKIYSFLFGVRNSDRRNAGRI
jgi:hypothetical protein